MKVTPSFAMTTVVAIRYIPTDKVIIVKTATKRISSPVIWYFEAALMSVFSFNNVPGCAQKYPQIQGK